ncbi:S-adenosyl-L-methionine-dependent methyltransferase [Aspergillus carlsbadensis]|nr:S-adenosyl-L-methionine-dependent methyltransferase [Aspergillus carlsbadensis]
MSERDNEQIIEVEDDADSTLGSLIASETSSLNSLVLQFEYENGRRYHSYRSGHYAFPNDEDELDRMDLEHHIFLLLLEGELHLAPLSDPQRILDLGTGTGIWAIDIADKYPGASVLGTDLSPVQPSFVPPNLEFQIDDFENEWTFRRESFDLIHTRLLLASVSDYPKLFRQALDALKPGAYMEIHEIDPGFETDDNSIPSDSSALQWSNLFFEGCAKINHRIPSPDEYKTMMEEAGFVDVKLKVLKRPSNPWPKDKDMKRLGLYTLTNHLNGLHAFTVGLFTRVLGWSTAEVEVLIAKCRKEWKDSSIHAYQRVIFLHGKKPETPSS